MSETELMQCKLTTIINLWVWFSLLLCGNPLQLLAADSTAIHLVYTGNINCALDDCGCSSHIVGGFTRILTTLDSLEQKYPDLILVDAGDYFSSYSMPDANELMLGLISRADYDAVNLGDQEFVETPEFVFDINEKQHLQLPFISSNLSPQEATGKKIAEIKEYKRSGIPVTFMAITDPAAFEFISLDRVRLDSPENVLDRMQPNFATSHGIEILIFHGPWEIAYALISQQPWIDAVVLSHNQLKKYEIRNKTAFVECGTDGEYVGHLTMKRKDKGWTFHNEFIPIHDQILPDTAAQKKVNDFYTK